MQQKKITFKIKGMIKDFAESSVPTDNGVISSAYELYNMRVAPTDDNTMGCLVNERGNQDTGIKFEGTTIGVCSLNQYAIVFTVKTDSINTMIEGIPINKKVTNCNIYRITENKGVFESTLLYSNPALNFSTKNPIQCFLYFETLENIKCYWIDGINSPRVLNILKDYTGEPIDTFDFTAKLPTYTTIESNKENGTGIFKSGVIQYVLSSFYKNGKESAIFWYSPLNYVTFPDRGGSPEDTIATSFKINITGLDTKADYIRLYSIYRTSIDAIPTVKKVIDVKVAENLTLLDDNIIGEIVDPTILFYLGAKEIIPKTMEYKDNTLFFGNYEVKGESKENYAAISAEIEATSLIIMEQDKDAITIGEETGFYPYKTQLQKTSKDITTFIRDETYRLGVIFGDEYGNWSSPFLINDHTIKKSITTKFAPGEYNKYIPIKLACNVSNLVSLPNISKYTYIRPVIVYPELNERKVICQGVVNPTVYNIKDRSDNSIFSQSSWCFRPIKNIDSEEVLNGLKDLRFKDQASITQGEVVKASWKPPETDYTFIYDKLQNYYSEIDSVITPYPSKLNGIHHLSIPLIEKESSSTALNSKYGNNFLVDHSFLTLNSPDIEFNPLLSLLDYSQNIETKIVGMFPITANLTNMELATDTSQLGIRSNKVSTLENTGSNILHKNVINVSKDAGKYLIDSNCWIDGAVNPENQLRLVTTNKCGYTHSIFTKEASLGNSISTAEAATIYSNFKQKRMSNYRYSNNSIYVNNPLYLGEEKSHKYNKYGIFNSNEISLTKIGTSNYYGNYDKIVTPIFNSYPDKIGFPIIVSSKSVASNADITHNNNTIYNGSPICITGIPGNFSDDAIKNYSIDPTSISYKSTPHIVINVSNELSNISSSTPKIKYSLPFLREITSGAIDNLIIDLPDNYKLFWDKDKVTENIRVLTVDFKDKTINDIANAYSYMYLVNLMRTTSPTFGGNTIQAIQANKWLPAGDIIKLRRGINIEWTEGDTYYQRYDCLKTYPFSNEAKNCITEIMSFMCETRINIDSKYDKNRILTDYNYVTPNNFNLFNTVYSQKNNYFTYRVLDLSNTVTSFPNSITWTKSKSSAENIDTWTNITLASTIDLDGDKGAISSINRLNNELIVFQDTGISQLLYNSRTQLSTNAGVPVELANSGKVDGKVYISNMVGCTNKWAIRNTQMGLFYIDALSKGVYVYNGKENINLSDTAGFHSWANKNLSNTDSWNLENGSYIVNYDRINGDVFISKNNGRVKESFCLAFNEQIKMFSSFYPYYESPFIFNIKDTVFSIYQDSLYKQYEGSYHTFYGTPYSKFYIEFIATGDGVSDKIFTNIEYRTDFFTMNPNETRFEPFESFDYINIENEYQKAEEPLTRLINRPSLLKQKHRIWRIQLPRNIKKRYLYRDRIRNPWAKFRLTKTLPHSNMKAKIHDIQVIYYQ